MTEDAIFLSHEVFGLSQYGLKGRGHIGNSVKQIMPCITRSPAKDYQTHRDEAVILLSMLSNNHIDCKLWA